MYIPSLSQVIYLLVHNSCEVMYGEITHLRLHPATIFLIYLRARRYSWVMDGFVSQVVLWSAGSYENYLVFPVNSSAIAWTILDAIQTMTYICRFRFFFPIKLLGGRLFSCFKVIQTIILMMQHSNNTEHLQSTDDQPRQSSMVLIWSIMPFFPPNKTHFSENIGMFRTSSNIIHAC